MKSTSKKIPFCAYKIPFCAYKIPFCAYKAIFAFDLVRHFVLNFDIKLTNREDRFHSSDDKAVICGIADSSQNDTAKDEEGVEGDRVVSQTACEQSKGEDSEDTAGDGKGEKFHWKSDNFDFNSNCYLGY